jgi:hypothetical protein
MSAVGQVHVPSPFPLLEEKIGDCIPHIGELPIEILRVGYVLEHLRWDTQTADELLQARVFTTLTYRKNLGGDKNPSTESIRFK